VVVIKQNQTIQTQENGRRILGFFYTLPAFVLYTLFMIFPIIIAIYISLQKWNGSSRMVFLGLENFIELLKSRDFWISIKNTVVLLIFNLCIQIPIAFFLAYLLYRTPKLMRPYRAIYFMPAAISTTVIGIMFALLLNGDLGPINYFLKNVGLGIIAKSWLSDRNTVLCVVILCMIWQYIGYHMVILLSGMLAISVEIIESAIIDGASATRIFFSIIVPLCRDMLQICVILGVIGSFKSFDVPYLMTWGGPGMSSTFIAVLMFKTSFLKADLGSGTAIGILILIFAFAGTRIVNWVFYHNDEKAIT
jgi:raffinose/stachyose/melibiose transport system permease protein